MTHDLRDSHQNGDLGDALTQIESLAREGLASGDPEHSCIAVEACVAILNKVKALLDE